MPVSNVLDFFIQWHLTERCNLRCKHCYQTGGVADEMTMPEKKDFVDEVSDMLGEWSDTYDVTFTPSFNITGGEPFMHEDVFEVLEEIRKRGIDTYVLSNGTLIDKEKAKLLSWLGVSGVQVSIEGPEMIHEAIRGKGSFKASLKGVQHLLDSGIMVTLNVTLSEINAERFMELITLSSSLGVHKLGFSRLVPSGRGFSMLDKMLKKEKLLNLYKEIFSAKKNGLKIVTGDPMASQIFSAADEDDMGQIPLGGCAAGISGLTILPDGTITPCRRLFIPIGNVRSDSLREVWTTSDVLQSLRDKASYKGKCGGCNRWSQCRGCRAIAYAYSQAKGEGDFLSEDPQCFIDSTSPF